MPMSEAEVFEKVKEALVEALSVDEDEVQPEAKIFADLGAESIDLLDIIFRLEKTFNIKIPRGELMPDNLLNNPEFVQNGVLTAAGVAQLKTSMPHVDLTEFEQDPQVNKIMDLFTVQTLVSYASSKVNQ